MAPEVWGVVWGGFWLLNESITFPFFLIFNLSSPSISPVPLQTLFIRAAVINPVPCL